MSTIKDIYTRMSSTRETKLERARLCAYFTQPDLLPPEGYGDGMQLPQPYSSVGARGVTSFASRLLTALMPVNDVPFFRLALRSGVDPPQDIDNLLNTVTNQVYRKLINTNLRTTLFTVLQQLIVVGDILIHMDDDFRFYVTRLDRYCVIRNLKGDPIEVTWIEYEELEGDEREQLYDKVGYNSDDPDRTGFKTIYVHAVRDPDTKQWNLTKQDGKGNLIDEGVFETVPNFKPVGWVHVAGENYSRSHCEENIGDISALDAYTENLQKGLAASSIFWMRLDPGSTADISDVEHKEVGEWIGVRDGEIGSVSPNVSPQVQTANVAVQEMREQVGQAFLSNASAIPSGDRVTATAIRFIGAELETVTGGAFSSVAEQTLNFIIKRTIFLMLESGELDPRLYDEFFSEGGELQVEVVTGLQALNRDTELSKLFQLAEVMSQLPDEARSRFKWSALGEALVSTLGFDPTQWVKSDEEVAQEQQENAIQQASTNAAAGGVQQAIGAAGQALVPQVAQSLVQDAPAGG